MQFNESRNSGKYQKQKNIVQGFKALKEECARSKAGHQLGFRQENANWAKNVKDINEWTNILCRHVLTGRVKAHKLCVKNYECYHCAYDQMIDDEDMELLNEKTVC